MIAHEILENDADLLTQIERVDLSNIDPVEKNDAFGGIVQPGQELDQCGFARTIMADERDFFPGTHR